MKKKILIVDDNLAVNKALQRVFEPRYETIPAMDGKQAVDIAVTRLPDLILMDIIMPVMDGFEATRLIRQVPMTRSIPIIAISAGLSNTIEDECFRIGCDDYLAKPFTYEQLVPRIEKLLNQDSA